MFHILMANFHHETNTFSPVLTGFEEYKSRAYALGDEVISKYRGTRSEVGGFIERLENCEDVRLMGVIMADAQPSGPVTADFYHHVEEEMMKAIRGSEKVDALLLSLHGAMVTEESLDGEGDFLETLRKAVGPNVPIIATLDLHSIITDKKAKNADVLINYDEYPHTDMFECGWEAADITIRALRREIKPVMCCRRLPMILPFVPSSHPAMKRWLDRAHEWEKDERVLSVSISHAFPYADVPELGASVTAVTNGDDALAAAIAEEIAQGLWADRDALRGIFYPLDEALDIVMASEEGLIVLADVTDNPGGGASCDATLILQAMLDRGVKNAVAAQLYDPETLAQCWEAGEGAEIEVELGGKRGPAEAGTPIRGKALVKRLTDGNYTNRDKLNGGYPVTLGRTALLTMGDIDIIVTASTEQPFDTGMLFLHGIAPREKHCILLKSAVHYKAAYEPLAARILPIHMDGGMLQQDIGKIPYKNITRPIYPLDEL